MCICCNFGLYIFVNFFFFNSEHKMILHVFNFQACVQEEKYVCIKLKYGSSVNKVQDID